MGTWHAKDAKLPAAVRLHMAHLLSNAGVRSLNTLLLQGTIEGRRDIAGGRLARDRRAAGNSTSGQCFTTLAFSADGAWILAGGASK